MRDHSFRHGQQMSRVSPLWAEDVAGHPSTQGGPPRPNQRAFYTLRALGAQRAFNKGAISDELIIIEDALKLAEAT